MKTILPSMITPTLIKIAYKKLKACVYYDKTQIILRNKIVDYEKQYHYDPQELENRFNEICTIINDPKTNHWEKYTSEILNSIDVLYFPKKLTTPPSFPINESSESVYIEQLQSFIDLNVEGQLLGILWIITIGKLLDKDLYVHSYGNRVKMPSLQKNNTNDMDNTEQEITPSFSPYLFAPYFLQYENWRDTALKKAKEIIENDQDAMILTMDFSRFYYSIHISEQNRDEYYQLFVKKNEEDDSIKKLNSFVYLVLKTYSMKHSADCSQIFLPIGFFPSNILANYCLKKFDDAILNQWNPSYYGRYVDDIIIVDKVIESSALMHHGDQVTPSDAIIKKFLCTNNCPKNHKACCINAKEKSGILLSEKKNTQLIYYINPLFVNDEKSKVEIQNRKVKLFYFKKTGSTILIDKFRKTLYKNTSEFRYLPEEDNLLDDGNYDEIFDLKSSDTINKFHSIESININKYSLSKFLGKQLRIRNLINKPNDNQFDKDILKIFDAWNILDNYNLWDRILQILILNDNFLTIKKFINHIMKTIDTLRVSLSEDNKLLYNNIGDYSAKVKKALLFQLQSALAHNLALIYGPNVKDLINHLFKKEDQSYEKFFLFSYDTLLGYRQGYCHSRMCDNSTFPAQLGK